MTEPYLIKKSSCALIPELRLLITLRYLATGDLPLTVALAFRVGESTVKEVVKEVCNILIKILEPLYLSPPTKEDWTICVHGYWKRWNIPNCAGSIDGKHIRLRCPPNFGSLYFNYKKFYSVVLLAVSDHLYRFTLVDIGAFGGKQ
ncbi:protein ANTAGONIST OF LIKE HETEROCHROMATIN PROTEIN 1-like [Solenopsis invicta]|uniref:protein ANTAGONIST OF LIKE HETEROCHROMATIN PROTEIN 1-like n=1 Tax=Solenopsis invicta TaxID=13686 RepID=UPI00193DAAD0|nr:protein ANTAGONIST OF LIKE HETEROCHROMATIN PROTEIN 1-like [Solenopsis invicta]